MTSTTSQDRYAERTEHIDPLILKQAHQYFNKWLRSHDIDELWERDIYDISREMYAPYNMKRDKPLMDALEALIHHEMEEHDEPVAVNHAALINLRYEDAI